MSALVIEVLSSTITTVPTAKGSYQVCELAFKNKSFQDKVEGKKIMSFAEKEVFNILSKAQLGDIFTVTRAKDDKGYWKWTNVSAGENDMPSNESMPTKVGNVSPKSTYETPEERAQRQLFIIKQSGVNQAIHLFEVQGNKKASVSDVISVAQQFVDYVIGKTEAAAPSMVGLNDDIPI